MQGATIGLQTVDTTAWSFNPRPLCRERRPSWQIDRFGFSFQSTPPMQGATAKAEAIRKRIDVSIHAPYAGSDVFDYLTHPGDIVFQSTPPMQGATPVR